VYSFPSIKYENGITAMSRLFAMGVGMLAEVSVTIAKDKVNILSKLI
jgi:hypothetical protein